MVGEEPGWGLNSVLADPKTHTLYSMMYPVSTALWGQGLPCHFCPCYVNLLRPYQVCGAAGVQLRPPSTDPRLTGGSGSQVAQSGCDTGVLNAGFGFWVLVPCMDRTMH